MLYRILVILLLVFSWSLKIQAQTVVRATVENGDTIYHSNLHYLSVVGERKFKSKGEARKYYRLQKKVLKVYPYAKMAGQKIEEYADELAAVDSERARKKFYKKIEKELKEEYEGELKKLTFTEGAILIKLIDRETGNTSYGLVQDMRGDVTAFFYQGMARIFGQNLKNKYDPDGEDREIELIVQQIEAGLLY